MTYSIDFGGLLPYANVLAKGAGLTVLLTAIGGTAGVIVGLFGAWARGYSGRAWLAAGFGGYGQ